MTKDTHTEDAASEGALDAPSDASAKTPPAAPEASSDSRLIPTWLAILVLVLIMAVVGLGGYVIRDLLEERDAAKMAATERYSVAEWESKAAEEPDDPANHLGLGFAYQQAGDYESALAEYDIVLEENPNDTAALYNKGTIYLLTGQGKKAEEVLWDVLEIEPTHALASKALGEMYAARGHYKSLLVAVQPAAEAHPEMADLQYLVGLAKEKTGDPEAAIAWYQAALEYVPDYGPAKEALERLGVED